MDLMQKIGNLEDAIFDFETANVANNMLSVFTETIETRAFDQTDASALRRLNLLMGECITAVKTGDYLLLADLLEYRLKPLIGGA